MQELPPGSYLGNEILWQNRHVYPVRILPKWPGSPGCTQLFSGRGVRSGFLKNVALANWFLSLKEGLVNWNFLTWGLRAKLWTKFDVVEAKISKFFSKWGLVNWLYKLVFLKWEPCKLWERREKGVRAAHPHTPFLGEWPPGSEVGPR